MDDLEMLWHVTSSLARDLERLPHCLGTRVLAGREAVLLVVWHDPDFDNWPVVGRILADGVWPAGVRLVQLGGEDEGLLQFRVSLPLLHPTRTVR